MTPITSTEHSIAEVFRKGELGHIVIPQPPDQRLTVLSILIAGMLNERFGELLPGLQDMPQHLRDHGDLPEDVEHAIVAIKTEAEDAFELTVYTKSQELGEEVGRLLDRLMEVL